MKSFIAIAAVAVCLFTASPKVSAQVTVKNNYASYLATLDTLTNADTTTYTVEVKGRKSTVSFSTDITKISGTVAGTIKIYGSVNGTTFLTTELTSLTITNASTNLGVVYTSNGYQKYKVVLINASGGVCSQRTYLLYKE